MKNSTLLRLFFISIGIPLTCASSAPTSNPDALILRDASNNAPAVQLEGTMTGVPSVSGKVSVSEMEDTSSKDLEALISSGDYEAVTKLAYGMDKNELLKCLCRVVTNLDHFKGLYKYLKQRNLVPDFLAHGDMVLIRKVIVGTELLETDNFGCCNSIYDAIDLSLNEGSQERVADLFEAAKERPIWENRFDVFVSGFLNRYHRQKNSMPLKRFLTLHGEEFSKQHPVTFKTICKMLVCTLKYRLDIPAPRKLLIGFVGQPSLLTPVAFAEGILYNADDTSRVNFVHCAYKEAIEEGLKEKYEDGGRKLWKVMVRKYPNQFSEEYPSTDEARTVALKDFPTKQGWEETWARKNAPILLKQLEMLVTELPKDLLSIVAEYAITWILV